MQEAARLGKIPWNVEEFFEVYMWYHNLQKKPYDDWDWRELGFSILDEDTGEIEDFEFNNLAPMNQLGFHVLDKYGKEDGAAHLLRFMQIMSFLTNTKNRDRLKHSGLYKDNKGQREYDEVKGEVIRALCELPYTKPDPKSISREWYVFDYDFVIERAVQLLQENEGGD